MRRIHSAALFSLLLAANFVRAADPPLPREWPTDPHYALISPESAALVRDLGAEDFATRDRASLELARRGMAAYPGLRIAIATSDDAEVLARTAPMMLDDDAVTMNSYGAPAAARISLASGDFAGAEIILRLALEQSREARTDFAALRSLRAGKAYDPGAESRALAELKLPPGIQYEAATYLFRAAGEYRQALGAAELADRSHAIPASYLPSIQLEARDYAGIAAHDFAFTPPFLSPPPNSGFLALRALGREPEAENIFRQVMATKPAPSAGMAELCIVNDHEEDLLTALKEAGQNASAFLILARQLRLREAFALRLERPVEAATLLLEMGLRSPARQLLLRYPPAAAASASDAITQHLEYAGVLRRAGLDALAQKYEDLAWETADSAGMTVDVQPLIPMTRQLADIQFWREFCPDRTDLQRFNDARRIVAGQTQPTFIRGLLPRILSSIDRYSSPSDRQFALQRAFYALEHVGEHELAAKLVNDRAEHEDLTALILLADWALEQKRPAEALAIYQRLAPYYRADASLMYVTGLAMSQLPDSREAGEQMMTYAPCLVLGNNSQASHLAETIRRFQGEEAANRWKDGWFMRLGPPNTLDVNYCLAHLRKVAEANGDIEKALATQTQALFRPSRVEDNPLLNAMAHMTHYHRLRALDALRRKDLTTLTDALNKIMAVSPPDVDLLEQTLPVLRAANPAVAQSILQAATSRLIPVVQDYPERPAWKEQLLQLQSLQEK